MENLTCPIKGCGGLMKPYKRKGVTYHICTNPKCKRDTRKA